MVSLARKLATPITTRALPAISKPHFEQRPPFIPFSHRQKIKQLEDQLIATLDVCSSLAQVKQTHAYIIQQCLHQSSYVAAKLVRTLSKLSVPMQPYGVCIFSQVKYPNGFLYSDLIRGFVNDGLFREAVLVYNSMRREGITPLASTLTTLLKACDGEGSVGFGRQIHGESVQLGGFYVDQVFGNVLVDMYLGCGCLGCARQVFDEMPERDLMATTSLIDAYAKAGNMGAAVELFGGLDVKDMVAWTAMVTGFVQNAKPKEALEYFRRMQSAGVRVDSVTLVGVINACAQLGSVKHANWVRDVAERSGLHHKNDNNIGSALIDMYSKCGSIDDAYKVFEGICEKNVISYSSMIFGLASHGHAIFAIELFEEMVKTGLKPNEVTFSGVLTACSHAGLAEQGQRLFDMMEDSYGVKPDVYHYNCMVDILGRTGQLERALKVIESMPMPPNAGVWGALLGSCRIYSNPDIAEVAARHLFMLDPENTANYILLANVYAKAEMWESVSKVRTFMREKGLTKIPAVSWVEGDNGVIQEFYAGDTTHPRSVETREALADLMNRLKRNGYQPHLTSVVYDVSEKEKRCMLMNHSEKLALAYVLISTDDGSAIRIMKNVRMCEDCHSFMCGASRVTGREIIIRDNLRFHHFRDGTCSCNNFW